VAQGLLDRAVGLSGSLRSAGVPVSLAESLDAARAMGALGLADRETLRAGLAAAMVKRAAHRLSFDALFDLWFPALTGEPTTGSGEAGDGGDRPGGPTVAQPAHATGPALSATDRDLLRSRLADLLLNGDDAALRRFAQEMVGRLGRAESQPGRQSYFAYRVLRDLAPETLTAALIAALLQRSGTERTPFTEEVARRTVTARAEAFRKYVDGDVRRRLAEERGIEQVARTAVAPLLEQVDFLRASRDDLAQLRRQVHPLARKLATRLSGLRDDELGAVAITTAYQTPKIYQGPYLDAGPDLIVGYAEGYRASWDAATGHVTSVVFENNEKAWCGDHCVDPPLVPGVLFSNLPVMSDDPGIEDLAPTALSLFGVAAPPWMEGRTLVAAA